MRLLSQYFEYGKLANVWFDRDETGNRMFIVKILGEEDKVFATEFEAEQYADDYVKKPVKEVSISDQIEMDYPEVELEYNLVQDPGVIKLKPVNQKSRKKIDKE